MTNLILKYGRLIGVAILLAGCGDPLVDVTFRGEPLFSLNGTTEPLPGVTGAEFICDNQLNECITDCDERLEEFDASFEGEEESLGCFISCEESRERCVGENSDTSFEESYYGSQDEQRIAIIWADPGNASLASLQQRTVTVTEFPARYTFSVFHPPPKEVLFDGSYAYGLIVSFIDRNRDEILDLTKEPIIGLNTNAAVHYRANDSTSNSSGDPLGFGTLTRQFSCPQAPETSGNTDVEDELSDIISITGVSILIYDNLADVDCDGTRAEWKTLCQMPQTRARCNQTATQEGSSTASRQAYQPICDFCSGLNPDALNEVELF